ncbi:MAG: M17 family peptidase N-terminal domain-containing protein, partial [Candidatus Berkiella sp.]
MDFSVKVLSSDKMRTDCLVLFMSPGTRFSPYVEKLNDASQGYLAQLKKRGDLNANRGQMLLIPHIEGINAQRLLMVGTGKEA